MSANILPTELLQNIFNNLHVGVLTNCRAVCRRWRDIIDDSPHFWKDLCEEISDSNDHDFCRDSKRKAGLSWREYCKSIMLWPQIADAEAKIHKTEINTGNFEVLPNGILACTRHSESKSSTLGNLRDTIVYYDLETLEERDRRHVGVHIKFYRETEQIIVVVDKEWSVHVILKANNKKFLVGKLMDSDNVRLKELIVLESEVYFKDPKFDMYCAQVGIVDNELTVQTENLGFLDTEFTAGARVDNDQVNFLVTTGILSLKNGEFEEVCTISSYSMEENVNVQLEENGFKWSQPEVFYSLSYYDYPFEGIPKNIVTYKSPIICGYGSVVLVGTTRGLIHVFKTQECSSHRETWCSDFFEPNKEYKAKLVKSVDLKAYLKDDPFYSKFSGNIKQMEIVETVNGHKIIVLFSLTICIIDLLHEPKKGKKRSGVKRPKPKTKKSKK